MVSTAKLPSLKDFIGQKALISLLLDEVAAAKAKRAALGNLLFGGPPGTGKSLLAAIIAQELGVDYREILGSGVNPLTLTDFICSTNASGYDQDGKLINPMDRRPSIRVFNECERIKREILEQTHQALEPDATGYRALPVKVPGDSRLQWAWCPEFTSIWITNYTGEFRKRGEAVVSRCTIKYMFTPYDEDELSKVILHHAAKKGYDVTKEAVTMIAERSLGIPRTAVNLLERMNNKLIAMKSRNETRSSKITADIARATLEVMGIDDLGLDPQAVRYLKVLAENDTAKMGVTNLAARLGLDPETVQTDIESFLIPLGLVNVVPGGRVITEKGLHHVGLGAASSVKARIIRRSTT